MKTGAQLITEERARQISAEGWDAGHDDEHDEGQMCAAAECYAEAAELQVGGITHVSDTPKYWPWEYQWWKPSADPVRNLVKAGALIAAEIDRLQRISK